MSTWSNLNGWLGVLGPTEAACGIGQYARQQARALGCPLYGYQEFCPADVLIVNYGYNTTRADHGALLEHIKLRKARIVIDIHNPDGVQIFDGLIHYAIAHSAHYQAVAAKYFDVVTNIPLPIPTHCKGAGQNITPALPEHKVGWYGLWQPNKGIKRLARAVRGVRDGGLDAGVVAMGARCPKHPEYVVEARKYVDSIKMGRHCLLDHSLRTYNDAAATLSTCDVLCLPYHKPAGKQDQSSAATFLLSLGRPVLVSPDPSFDGVREYCFTVPDGSAENFTHWIRAFLVDSGLQDKYGTLAASYQRVAGIDVYQERLRSFLDEAIR